MNVLRSVLITSTKSGMGEHSPDEGFASSLRRVYARFQDDHAQSDNGVLIQEGNRRFLGVRTQLQGRYNPSELRSCIEDMLDVSHASTIVQVVGDSGNRFTWEGIEQIKNVISRTLHAVAANGKHLILEYGYTAGLHDVNWVVNDMVATNPGLCHSTIGNLVHMSSIAVEGGYHEATGLVCNFVLAYDTTETGFGEDTWLSDSIMSNENGDVLICAEGGPQAFYQAASVCARQVSVIAIWGHIRDTRTITDAGVSRRFSASYLLRRLGDVYDFCIKQHWSQGEMRHRMKVSLQEYLDALRAESAGLSPGQEELVWEGFDKIAALPRVVQHITFGRHRPVLESRK